MSVATVPVNLAETYTEIDPNGLIGEIVSAESPQKIPHSILVQEMLNNNLNASLAKDMAPKNALKRALHEMDEGRVIRKVEETATTIRFQFTKEVAAANGFVYNPEDFLTMDKVSGKCYAAQDQQLAVLADKLVAEKMGMRTSADVARIFMKTFESTNGIYPVRRAGGCYFVPIASQDLIERFEKFMEAIGGSLRRIQIPGGAVNLKTMAEAVVDGTRTAIEEYRAAIEDYSETTAPGVISNRVNAILELRQRKMALRHFFGEQIDALDTEFDALDKLLQEKNEEVVRGKQSTASVPPSSEGGQ